MVTEFYLIFLHLATCMLSYTDASLECRFTHLQAGYLGYNPAHLNRTGCGVVDHLISINSSRHTILKLKFQPIFFNELEIDVVVVEIFVGAIPINPAMTVSKSELRELADTKKLMKFESSSGKILLRLHKMTSGGWPPLIGWYQPKGVCLPGQLKCSDEEDCYQSENRCDGVWDCEEHGFDELNCSGCIDTYRCWNKTSSDLLSCYTSYDRCSGHQVCLYEDDQKNCDKKKCNPARGAFLCKNKKCIKSDWVCDGIDDCRDFSDEKGCSITGSSQVTVIAVAGSISCIILSIIIILFSCKLYMLRKRRSRERTALIRGEEALISALQEEEDEWWSIFFSRSSSRSRVLRHHGQHVSPITEVQNDIFARLSAPPSYQVAMATSRSFDEVVAEEMARNLEANGENSDDELLDLADPPGGSATPSPCDDPALLDFREDAPMLGGDPGTIGRKAAMKKNSRRRNPGDQRSFRTQARRAQSVVDYEDEPPTFEEAIGESSRPAGIFRQSSAGDPNDCSDDSSHVPPSYSSIFPLDEGSIPLIADDSAENAGGDGASISPKRFSFLRIPLQSIKSIFSRWSSLRPSMTELVGDRDEFSGSIYDCGAYRGDFRSDVAAGSHLPRRPNNQNGSSSFDADLRPQLDSVLPEFLAWSFDRSPNPVGLPGLGDADRIAVADRLSPSAIEAASPPRNERNGWRTFDAEGVYEGDYNLSVPSDDDDNDVKNG